MVDTQTVVACVQCGTFWDDGAEDPGCADPAHDHERFEVHRHRDAVEMPDGVVITAVSFDGRDPYDRDSPPDFGLYLDARWQPPWPHEVVDWPDFGLPEDSAALVDALLALHRRARAGEVVEIGCVGGHGRTGTALAALAVLCGHPPERPVEWVRSAYCEHAVETEEQEAFVRSLHAPDPLGRAGPVPEHLQGPWPDGRALLRREVDAYLADALAPADDPPTRCEPWTVSDITIHLAESLRRFAAMVDQARAGDLDPPFPPEEIDAENLRAVAQFVGDPAEALTAATTALLDRTTDLAEPVPHQIGVVPAGLQVLFGLVDVVLHHDDICAATGGRYPIPEDVLDALRPVATRLFAVDPDTPDLAAAILVGAGRPTI